MTDGQIELEPDLQLGSEKTAQELSAPSARTDDARRIAANEIGAAISHEITEPLTALMLYVQELKRSFESEPRDIPAHANEMLESALREITRVFTIMDRIRDRFEGADDLEMTVARGCDVINWLKRTIRESVATDATVLPRKRLTAREREVLALIAGGSSNKAGAITLKMSPRTFESHRAKIMRKLSVRNTVQLVRAAPLEIPALPPLLAGKLCDE